MKRSGKALVCGAVVWAFLAGTLSAAADRRAAIYSLGLELEKKASEMAEGNFVHFKGRNSEISDKEQAVLFKSEAFAASCRLFLRLTEERSDYFTTSHLRTNLYNAFLYLTRDFGEMEEEMRGAGVMPYALSDCRKSLDRMEAEFAEWPAADNLAYLDKKYVKARDAGVWLIEKKGVTEYVRRPFKNLESLFRYNFDLGRGKDPWKYLVEISAETLDKINKGGMIELTFEGFLVIESGTRPNRSVYLIENGKKRGITSPAVLDRLGGWGKVLEVPAEIIAGYPEGEPII